MSAATSSTFARLSEAEALELYTGGSIHELGRRALGRAAALHPEPYRTYVVDRNINYANVCRSHCSFCNFCRAPGDPDAYVLTYEQIGRKIEELLAIGGTQILMQGGLLPDERHPSGCGRPFAWYLELLRFIKRDYPAVHIHAFSPPEIWWFHRTFGLPLADVLRRLRDAGLDTIPGGGGEILVDRVRRAVAPGKAGADEWLSVMRAAHGLGMKTSATMMFGHVETVAERIEHLRRLRDLQDETGGFVAFIHWPFQPAGTRLAKRLRAAADGPSVEDPFAAAGAHEYLRLLAVTRLYLDNVANIQASWVTMGPKIGQLALFFGANDMGSVMMEENVVSSAGTAHRLDEAEIRRLIGDAGWQPQRRDQYYRPVPPTAGQTACA